MTSSVEIDTVELFCFVFFSLEGDPGSYSLNLSPSQETVLRDTIGRLTSLYLSKMLKPSKRNIKVSLASAISSIGETMIKIFPRNILRQTFNFFNREMGIFSSLGNILVLAPQQRTGRYNDEFELSIL